MNKLAQTQITVGVDISQSQLDIFIRPTGHFESFTNDDKGIRAAVRFIAQLAPTRVIFEATGRLEIAYFCAAHKANYPFASATLRKFVTSQKRQVALLKPTVLMPKIWRSLARECSQL